MPIIIPTGMYDRVKSIQGKDRYVKLLLHMDGSDNGTVFTDECGHTVTRYGAVTKTGTKQLGTAAGFFDGTDDYLDIGSSSDFLLKDCDWTIDFWLYVSSSTAQYRIIDFKDASNVSNMQAILISGSSAYGSIPANNIAFFEHDTARNVCTEYGSSYRDKWTHVAITSTSANLTKIYLDGVYKAGATITRSIGTPTGFRIGSTCNGDYYFNGYLDEFRISKGIARWTSNFTPPVCAYY